MCRRYQGNEMLGAYVAGALGLGIATISAWLHIRGKDGSGWALVAFLLIVTSCSRSGA